jgi:hypothetical protein
MGPSRTTPLWKKEERERERERERETAREEHIIGQYTTISSSTCMWHRPRKANILRRGCNRRRVPTTSLPPPSLQNHRSGRRRPPQLRARQMAEATSQERESFVVALLVCTHRDSEDPTPQHITPDQHTHSGARTSHQTQRPKAMTTLEFVNHIDLKKVPF